MKKVTVCWVPVNCNRKEERGVFKMENELFEKTKVSKAYMTLALPVVLGMVVSLIYNMVDTFSSRGPETRH